MGFKTFFIRLDPLFFQFASDANLFALGLAEGGSILKIWTFMNSINSTEVKYKYFFSFVSTEISRIGFSSLILPSWRLLLPFCGSSNDCIEITSVLHFWRLFFLNWRCFLISFASQSSKLYVFRLFNLKLKENCRKKLEEKDKFLNLGN